jgi:hypothetical protein
MGGGSKVLGSNYYHPVSSMLDSLAVEAILLSEEAEIVLLSRRSRAAGGEELDDRPMRHQPSLKPWRWPVGCLYL